MAYQMYERLSVRVEDAALTFRPEGRIGINAAATRVLEKAGVKVVRLLWDQAANRVALQGAPMKDKNCYSIAFSKGRSASLTAKSFFRYIGWSSKRRQMVPATWNEKQGMLEATLPAEFVGWSEKEIKRKVKTGQ